MLIKVYLISSYFWLDLLYKEHSMDLFTKLLNNIFMHLHNLILLNIFDQHYYTHFMLYHLLLTFLNNISMINLIFIDSNKAKLIFLVLLNFLDTFLILSCKNIILFQTYF